MPFFSAFPFFLSQYLPYWFSHSGADRVNTKPPMRNVVGSSPTSDISIQEIQFGL